MTKKWFLFYSLKRCLLPLPLVLIQLGGSNSSADEDNAVDHHQQRLVVVRNLYAFYH